MGALPFALGMLLAACVAGLGNWTRFDRDRGFFPTLLIVIATYYLLFAVMAEAGAHIILPELLICLAFVGLAIFGGLCKPPLVAAGLLLHGVLDLVHPTLIGNPGVPDWWPGLCAGFDFLLGAWVFRLVATRVNHE